MRNLSTLLLATIFLSGCVSVVNVDKVVPGKAPAGITYYLPQTFLVLTPAVDGSMKVETLYLPDPAHQYSVKAYSVLGNYTIDVNRSPEGFLETVSFNSDNTGIAKQLVSTQANLRAAEIDAGAAAGKTKALEDKAAADKAAAAIAAAESAQAAAAVAVQVAQARLDYLTSLSGSPDEPEKLRDQIVAATLALREAQVKHSAALTVQSETASRYASANAPIGGALKAPEPMFLKVNMTEDSVSLTKAFDQKDRETWKIPVSGKKVVEFEVLPSMLVMRPARSTGALTGAVRSTIPLVGFVLNSVTYLRPTPPQLIAKANYPLTQIQFDKSLVLIDMPKTTPPGDYKLAYTFHYMDGETQKEQTSLILVRVEK